MEGEVIVQRLLGQGFEVGYNAMYDRVENLIDAGVLDPAKASPCPRPRLLARTAECAAVCPPRVLTT